MEGYGTNRLGGESDCLIASIGRIRCVATRASTVTLLAASLLSYALSAASGFAMAADRPVATILREAEERRRIAGAFRIKWEEEQTIVAGMMGGSIFGAGEERYPLTDQTVTGTSLLYIDGTKQRYERDGLTWISRTKSFEPRHYISTFDGSVGKNFHSGSPSLSRTVTPVGFIRKEASSWEPMIPDICAPLVVYGAAINTKGRYEVKPGLAAIKGTQCDVLVSPADGADAHFPQYWVDRTPRRNVRRVTWHSKGKPTMQLDLAYAPTEEGGKLSGWTGVILIPDSGVIKRQFAASVVQLDFQQRFNDDDFQLEYPARTEVVDYRDDSSYISLEDGTRRVITAQERARGATYFDFLATQSGEAKASGVPWRGHITVVLNCIFIVGLAAFFLFRSYRSRRLAS